MPAATCSLIVIIMADNFEDDFVPDGLVSLSEEELDLEPEENQETHPSPNDRTAVEKKRKRKEKLKESKAKRRKLTEIVEATEDTLAGRSPQELAAYISSLQAKTYSDLSDLELDDIRVPDNAIVDTTQWAGSRSLDNLVPFIIKILPGLHTRLSQKSKSTGAPTLLFITAAALRVADVTRVLKDRRLRGDKGGEVAKLFAKHIKLSEHVAYLKRTKVGAAVGTPGRIGKLLLDGLSTSALSHIMLDTTHRDAKRRNLFDIPETRDEVFKSIFDAPGIIQGIKGGKIQVVLF